MSTLTTSQDHTGDPAGTGQRPHSGFRRGALGFPGLIAQSIAVISPTMTAVLIIPLAFANAGQGTWLAYLFGTVMLLFVVLGLNRFAHRSSTAGSMYAYTGRGLGPGAGVLSGWTLIWSYLFIGVAGLSGFAVFSAQLLTSLGFHGSLPPVLYYAVSAAGCWALAYRDIRLSSLLALVLEGLSVLCILALACVVLFSHGLPVDHGQLSLKGIRVSGISLAVVTCIFSLVGFESATAMGSEARDPLRTIPRAVVWSLLLTGLFFTVISYAEVYGTRHSAVSLAGLAAPLNNLSELFHVGWFRIPLSVGAMVSFFSLTLSCLNAGARIIHPMARSTVFPRGLGRTHPRNATPHLAVTGYILLILAVPVVLTAFGNDPLTVFNDAGSLAAYGFLLAYFLISAAAPAYLRKLGELRRRDLAVAVTAFLCLLVPTIGSFYPVPAYPATVFPYLFLGYLALGAGWLHILRRHHRDLLPDIGTALERSLSPDPDATVA